MILLCSCDPMCCTQTEFLALSRGPNFVIQKSMQSVTTDFFVGRRFAMMQLINMWPTMYSGFHQHICPDGSDNKFLRQHPDLVSKMLFPSNTNAEYWNSYFYSVAGLSYCTVPNKYFNLPPFRQSGKLPNRSWSIPPPSFNVAKHGRNSFLC